MLKDAHALNLRRPAVNIELPKLPSIVLEGQNAKILERTMQTAWRTYLESVHVVREDNDLVSSILVILNKELARLNLAWIHAVQQHTLPRLFTQIFAVEFRCHRAPHFRALKDSHQDPKPIRNHRG